MCTSQMQFTGLQLLTMQHERLNMQHNQLLIAAGMQWGSVLGVRKPNVTGTKDEKQSTIVCAAKPGKSKCGRKMGPRL